MPRRSGPIAWHEVSAAHRELNESPHARLLFNALCMEGAYFPFLRVENEEEKKEVQDQIVEMLGLKIARTEGIILDYEIVWGSETFPSTPIRLVLFPPPREGCKPGHGWERFISRTFLREMRKFFRNFSKSV